MTSRDKIASSAAQRTNAATPVGDAPSKPPTVDVGDDALAEARSVSLHTITRSGSDTGTASTQISPPPSPVPHRDPDRYKILGEHGRGGLGRVSRAHDRELCRDVAIKELISRAHVSELRFLREALITARLEHPGIVPLYEAGRWPDGTPFYAMKLVAGRPLRDLIADCRSVEARIVLLHHVIAVADAIAYAHGRNIIHRDLKPGNVIVGDFGETIVIDWGLAKDLSVSDEFALPGEPPSSLRSDDLTKTGSVLGTPSYMAPEQERGEHVDQRADVFAIGAMLWELCALQKVPPTDPDARRRLLRRNGIDADLITIIDKALAPDPSHRYADAGALAADLKAFKSGARISARSYSLLAVLGHWIRRHRTLTWAVLSIVVLALVGVSLYIHDIRAERDSATAARAAADAANKATEVALAEQTLGHAEVLLTSDPSSAADLLDTYKGADRFHRDILRAQAEGRGVAVLRGTPHTDSIIWMHELADGSIATLSTDGKLSKTSPSGATTVLVETAGVRDAWAYYGERNLLAYACEEQVICLFDFSLSPPRITSRLAYAGAEGIAFSPTGAQLAAVARTNPLTTWDLHGADQAGPARHGSVQGFGVGFTDESTLVVVDSDSISIIRKSQLVRQLIISSVVNYAFQRDHSVVVATAPGAAFVVGGDVMSPPRRVELCQARVLALAAMPTPNVVAYGCKDGKLGLWNTGTGAVTPLATVPGAIYELGSSADGQYLAAGGTASTVFAISLRTHMVTTWLGHSGRISAIAALYHASRLFATADSNGHFRAWNEPPSIASVAYTASARLYDAEFLQDDVSIVTTSPDPLMHFVSREGLQDVADHAARNFVVHPSDDHAQLAAFGGQDRIEIWSGVNRDLLYTIDTQHLGISQVMFINRDDLVYANNAGSLIRWRAPAQSTELARFKHPVAGFAVLEPDRVVIDLDDGSLWQVVIGHPPTAIPQVHAREHLLSRSKDRRWVATGNEQGEVVVYDTRTWHAALNFHDLGAVQHVAISPTDDVIAIAMKSGALHLGRRTSSGDRGDWQSLSWHHFSAHPRYVAFSPTGDLFMATTSEGVIWFYSPARDRWLSFFSGIAGLTVLSTSRDGQRAATVDSIGRLTTIDLNLVRSLLADNSSRRQAP